MARQGTSQKSKKGRKVGRNKAKCESYRRRIGKPRGPGKSGAKAGKNKGV